MTAAVTSAVTRSVTSAVAPPPVDSPQVDRGPSPRPSGSTALKQRLLRPGWPLVAIFVPFPLWWVLGLTEWIVPIMVVPMALHLLRQRTVLVPRGFGVWMAFLLWVMTSGFLLQVDALGAVADNSSTRWITFGYRLGWYVAITVVLLYVVNTRREFSTTRIVRIVACLFLTVTAGGLLGVVVPSLEFKSLAELVLPGSIAKIPLIKSMIHPQSAQLMGVLGYVSPRPSAPYPFTNTWGLNFTLTLPFFLLAWLGKDAGWRKMAAGPVLLVAAVPFVISVNRGMWAACVVVALFVAIRSALTGRPGVLAGVVSGALVVALILAVTPLGTVVALRFSSKGSEEGRTDLGTLAIRSVSATSPIVGLGSTRNVQGSFNSISQGSTAQCPACSPPSLGTQGQVWLVAFSQGLVGLALFLTFFGRIFLRHVRQRSPVVSMCLAVMVGWTVTLAVYNSLGTGMLVLMVAVGLLCREGSPHARDLPTRADPCYAVFDRYLGALRTGIPVLVVLGLVGVSAGWWWHVVHPTPYQATATVLLTEPPRYPSPGYARANADIDAQLVSGLAVRAAAAQASGEPLSEVTDRLTVTATPNTRVLHVHLVAPTARAARAGVDAATESFLVQRGKRLEADRTRELSQLDKSAQTLASAINMLDAQVRSQRLGATGKDNRLLTSVPRDHRNELLAQAGLVGRQTARVHGLVLSGGARTQATQLKQSGDRTKVDLVSGLTAGLGIGGLLVVLWGAAGPRLGRVRDIPAATGLPLLAHAPITHDGVRSVARLFSELPLAYVAALERDTDASAMAHRLAEATSRPRQRAGAVIVASARTRTEDVLACEGRLALQGIAVRGLMLAEPAPPLEANQANGNLWRRATAARATLARGWRPVHPEGKQ